MIFKGNSIHISGKEITLFSVEISKDKQKYICLTYNVDGKHIVLESTPPTIVPDKNTKVVH